MGRTRLLSEGVSRIVGNTYSSTPLLLYVCQCIAFRSIRQVLDRKRNASMFAEYLKYKEKRASDARPYKAIRT